MIVVCSERNARAIVGTAKLLGIKAEITGGPEGKSMVSGQKGKSMVVLPDASSLDRLLGMLGLRYIRHAINMHLGHGDLLAEIDDDD